MPGLGKRLHAVLAVLDVQIVEVLTASLKADTVDGIADAADNLWMILLGNFALKGKEDHNLFQTERKQIKR